MSRQPPHIHCEGELSFCRQAVPQVTEIRSLRVVSASRPLTLFGFLLAAYRREASIGGYLCQKKLGLFFLLRLFL
jgi:hypothetical protein